MSASDQMRKMLDELMGTQRDGVQEQDVLQFTSPSVCKSYLLGLCPYDLFHNTNSFKSSKKLDLGACSKVHDPALKADYEIAAKECDYDYEVEQLDKLSQFIADCDRKVSVNKRRLEETQDAESLGPEALAVHELNEQIGIKLAEAEELGADGKVEESMQIMAQVEDLKQQKRKAEDIYRQSVPPTTNQQQKLRVCEVCAAFLSLYDNDRRLADHFGGRLHMGFVKVRERLRDLEILVNKKREARESERQRRRDDRERDRGDKWRDDRNDRERDRSDKLRDNRDNNRNRDREQRDRDKDRDRERERDRDKEREREREREKEREREREREKNRNQERSREKERERERKKKSSRSRSRSRSRDSRRHHSNRSRSRSRERSRRDSRERSRRRESRDGSRDRVRRQSEERRSESRDKSPRDGDSMEEGEVEDAADEQEPWKASSERDEDV